MANSLRSQSSKYLSYYKALPYFLTTFLGSWFAWLIGIYLQNTIIYQFTFIALGLFMPGLIAIFMIYASQNPNFIQDFWARLNFKTIKLPFLPLLFFLIPCIFISAVGISLFFGQSVEQLKFARQFVNIQDFDISSIILIILATFIPPIGEELGWRGYGMDSIKLHFNLFNASLLFGCIWAVWHLPLFFIPGFYNTALWGNHTLYEVNFFLSTVAQAFLINWVYYKNNRNIITAIILHLMFNVFTVFFQTTDITQCIMTFLLILFLIGVIVKNKPFFFENKALIGS